jgi:hypothetical protein
MTGPIEEIQAPLTVVSELVAEEQGFIPDRARGLFTVVSELVTEEQELFLMEHKDHLLWYLSSYWRTRIHSWHDG